MKCIQFNENTKLCVVSCLDEYTKQRNTRVPADTGSLLITFGKPYRKPSDDTFARWIKTELVNAGIDISLFKAHSCRSASSSKTKNI